MSDDELRASLRIIDYIEAEGVLDPREEFIRQVRLLDCVREVIEMWHDPETWALIYEAADRMRRRKALNLQRTGVSWET